MTIERTRLDFNREKRVLINLILNTQFCNKVLPVIRKEYFNAKYAETLIDWIKVYYESYGVAPKLHINEVYEEHSVHLDSDISEQVGGVLQHLSDVADTEVHNVDYLVDIADTLFREKHLELQNDALKRHLEKGDLQSAEETLLEQYQGIEGGGKEFIAFDDKEFIRDCVVGMMEQQEASSAFFRFSGRLGDFIGPIDRGWFIAYLAPAKRGKTTYMLDAVIDSVFQRKNTLVISLEMPEKQLMQRYILSITGAKPGQEEYTVTTPVMDCVLNQTAECEKDERTGYGAVLEDDNLTAYEDNPDWEVCTACRGTSEMKPTAWPVPVVKEPIDESRYMKKINKFNKLFGKHGKIVHFPSKTQTVRDLKNHVENLKVTQNFIPDVIVLDYADLIKPDASGEKRHQLDDIWEGLRGWGQEEHVLIISASQTNRTSADAEYIRDVHVAEDYSKIAKLDIAIGLCQTDRMKELGIMNLNKVAHRHKEYVQSNVCTVLQELSHQQSHLDSEFTSL